MTSREIILEAIKLKPTPRQPVALLSGGIWTINRQGLSLKEALAGGAELIAQILAESNQDVRSDIVWVGSGYHNIGIHALGGKIKFESQGAPDVVEPLIKEASQLNGQLIDRLPENDEVNILWNAARCLSQNIGRHTLVGASQWGPFTLAGLIYGEERLMYDIDKNPAAVHEVLAFTSELCSRYLTPFVDRGAEMVSVADPTSSGDIISLAQFEEFSLPYLKEVTGRLRARGALVTIHICGDISNRLHLIPLLGADLLSMDYKVDLADASRILGKSMAFAGNIDPEGVMQNETPQGVVDSCLICMKKAGADCSHILMPGCDIPPGVPLENIQAMVATAFASRPN